NGARRGKQVTFVRVDDWVAPSLPRSHNDALRDLVRRYFQSHGPATVHDAGWWSGLTLTDIRHGIERCGDDLEQRTIDRTRYWAAVGGFEPATVPRAHVLLLSNYDEVLGSYADYSPIVAAEFSPPNWTHDSIGPHVVLRNGLVAGGWRRGLTAKRLTV